MVQSIRPLIIIFERSLVLRKYVTFSAIILFTILTAGCTITHEFGPFMGKVVDTDAGEPIEGAVVLIIFSVETGTLGGTVTRDVDAVETLTDAQGEFRFFPKRINFFKVMANWCDDHQILIFKPGYGAYPEHPKVYSSWKEKQSYFIPENKHITYYLPKLYNLEDRSRNLRNIRYPVHYPGGITNDNYPILRRLKNEERVNVGLKP